MNEEKLYALLGKMVTELGAAYIGASVIIGDKLGLYKALVAAGPLNSEQLAKQTGTTERYVRLTTGIDAMDAAPIRGHATGGPRARLCISRGWLLAPDARCRFNVLLKRAPPRFDARRSSCSCGRR